MTDRIAGAQRAANTGAGAMARLADRLAALSPPRPVLELTNPLPPPRPSPAAAKTAARPVRELTDPLPPPQPSPAVKAALKTTAALAARADRRARRSRSIGATLVDGLVAACALVPYAVVALAARLVLARVFFLDGQAKFDGFPIPLKLGDVHFSLTVPLQLKAEAAAAFIAHFGAMPMPPALAAHLVGYAELLLPVMLVLGFGTRIAALGLLAVTALIQVYVMPQALWSAHVYWALLLLVLLSRGAGALSIDHFIRLARRT